MGDNAGRDRIMSFDVFCAKNGIIGDTKIRFELWVGNILDSRTEAEWRELWTRYRGITPRRARVGD